MARSKQKTVGQQVIGVAAVGMPTPVKKVVASRWGARLCLVLFGALCHGAAPRSSTVQQSKPADVLRPGPRESIADDARSTGLPLTSQIC